MICMCYVSCDVVFVVVKVWISEQGTPEIERKRELELYIKGFNLMKSVLYNFWRFQYLYTDI